MANRILNGHNGDVSKNTILSHYTAIRDLEKKKKEIASKITAQKKAAADDGVDVKDLMKVGKELLITEAEQIERENRMIWYRRCLGVTIGEKQQFVEDTPLRMEDMTEEERRAYWRDEGLKAGRAGNNRDTCPHQLESEAAILWMEGYDEGQAANAPKKGGKVVDISSAKKNEAQEALNEGAKKRSGRGRPKKVKPEEQAPPAPEEESAPAPDEEKAQDPEGASEDDAWDNEPSDTSSQTTDDDWDAAAPSPDEGA